jgi:hypothetical protein
LFGLALDCAPIGRCRRVDCSAGWPGDRLCGQDGAGGAGRDNFWGRFCVWFPRARRHGGNGFAHLTGVSKPMVGLLGQGLEHNGGKTLAQRLFGH